MNSIDSLKDKLANTNKLIAVIKGLEIQLKTLDSKKVHQFANNLLETTKVDVSLYFHTNNYYIAYCIVCYCNYSHLLFLIMVM